LSERVDYPRGHARNPLTDAELEGKFHGLVDSRLGPQRADDLLRSLWHMDQADSIKAFLALLEVHR
jgi:2-methylcitrate dehydratase